MPIAPKSSAPAKPGCPTDPGKPAWGAARPNAEAATRPGWRWQRNNGGANRSSVTAIETTTTREEGAITIGTVGRQQAVEQPLNRYRPNEYGISAGKSRKRL